MEIRSGAATLTLLLMVLLGNDVMASTTLRDFSGDSMQVFSSRMMSSPMTRFPGLFGISPWPWIVYPSSPSMTVVNVYVQIPEVEQRPVTTAAPPARPKFWIARCGSVIELGGSTTNLIDEERKPCAP